MIALALAHTGFVALCLAMQRHREQVLRHRSVPARRDQVWRDQAWRGQALRAGGWLLLAASLAPPVARLGWGLGLVSWLGLLTAAALPVVLLLTYRPRWVLATGALALPAALLAAALGAA